MIQHFTRGPPAVVDKLNELIDEANKVSRIVGDGVIRVQRSSHGMTIGINRSELATLIPKIGSITSEGLLAWYLFNDNAEDSSGNDHDGTFGGGMGASLDVAEFDGDDDNVDCGSDYIGISPLTIFARIRPLTAGEGNLGRIVDNGKTIFRCNGLGAKLSFSNDGDTIKEFSASNSIKYHKWHDVAVTRDAEGTVNFYVNGILSGTADQSSTAPVVGTSNVFIGNNSGGTGTFLGNMDDVRIYNRVLAVHEIRRITDEHSKNFIHANEQFGATKIFEVQHAATAGGDGLYDCYEQSLDAANWASTDGTPKIANANITEVEVLNLAEHDPEATYVAHLAANDLIIAVYRNYDDEANARWAGVPIRQANADRPRIAYCSEAAGAQQTIAATLDHTTGTAI